MDSTQPTAPAQTSVQAPRVPARIVLASIAALWVTYFALATLRGWLVGLELHDALLRVLSPAHHKAHKERPAHGGHEYKSQQGSHGGRQA